MKITLFVVLIVAFTASAFSGRQENGQIKFDMDVHKESPIGLFVSGLLDPRTESNNNIQTFLRLANQYIPILKSIANEASSLNYEYNYRIQVAGLTLDIYVYFQLYVGWKVNPGSYSASYYEVTYTPFVFGHTAARVNGTSWPAIGSTRFGLVYADVSAPIGVTLYREGKVCFGGRYIANPISLSTDLYAALNACEDEIIDKIINGQSWALRCNYTNPVNVTIIQKNFTDVHTGDLIPQTCFVF